MFSTSEKTNKHTSPVQQRADGPVFFRKAGEETYFGSRESPSFFRPAIQPKLSVSTPDDPQEKEADGMADRVMRMQDVGVTAPAKEEEKLQRKEDEEEQVQAKRDIGFKLQRKEEEEETVQAKPLDTPARNSVLNNQNNSNHSVFSIQRSGRGPPSTSAPFEQTLSSTKGRGSPLPSGTQQVMESRFQADFSSVRVHTGSYAESMSSQIQAQAFTHGSDIYFNSGKYSPGTSAGTALLAHELTHTVQQGASPAGKSIAPKRNHAPPHTHVFAKPLPLKQSSYHFSIQRNAIGSVLAGDIDLSGKTGGAMLSPGAREYLQDYYKAELGDIRIHTDSESVNLCRMLGVRAFTQGKHICILPWRYDPDSEEGAILLSEKISESLKQRGIKTTASDSNSGGGLSALINQIVAAVKENRLAESSPAPKAKAPPVAAIPDTGKAKKQRGDKAKGGKEKDGKKDKRKRARKDGEGPLFKPVKRDPKRSPSTPAEDPAFLRVVKKTKTTAKNQRDHGDPVVKADDAQKNADAVPKEADSKAQTRKTDGMSEASKKDIPFDAESFKADLLQKIESITPKTLEEATEFKDNNKIGEVRNAMGNKVADQKQNTTEPVNTATTQPLKVNDADNKKPLPLPPTLKGAKPPGVGAAEAAPKNKTPGEISMQEQSNSLDQEMKDNNVTENQLAGSNEPGFVSALKEKKNAQKDAAEKPKLYRKEESLALKEAKETAGVSAAQGLTVMHNSRGKNFESSVKHQQTAKEKDEARRAEVARTIEEKYKLAEEKVTTALTAADTEANRIFDEGSEAARVDFETYVDRRMRDYKRRRYSGFWGGLKWAKDKLFGMPDAVNEFYVEGRKRYIDKMDQVITAVAKTVTKHLNEAKQAITDGKKDVDHYVSLLPKDLIEVGKEAATSIQDKFDSLEQTVNDKRNDLIEGLAKKYVDNVKKLDERINELKEANKGLIDKAIGFLKKVWKVIKDLVNLFRTILARLASIIGVILDSPSGFFDNLGKAFNRGFNNFKDKFLDYLEQGLMDWLATNLGIAGIELPQKFSAAAIFSLVLQVLGITKQHIRERAVVVLGERKVGMLEKAGGILYRVYNEGLGALWDMIAEKLSDFKDIIWDAIKSFIKTKIIEAAIVFLLSLLNPIGAFIKVCMAIYDFLMMLVKFKDKIIELLDTILSAVTDIANGAIDTAANAIEKAFAKSIPIIIAFLAALLHLNNIASRVREIINKVRARVDKAIDWVIKKGYGLVSKFVEGAIRLEDKGAAAVDKAKQAVKGAGKKVASAVLGWLGIEKSFNAPDGSPHKLFFGGKGSNIEIMINPNPAGEYEKWIKNIETDTPDKKNRKADAIAVAAKIDSVTKTKPVGTPAEEAKEKTLRTLMDELSKLTGPLFEDVMPDCSVEGKGLEFNGKRGKYGVTMTAQKLTKKNMPAGSSPSKTSDEFAIINQRRNQGGSYYVLGHLLNQKLGGTGGDWKNLTPLTRTANSEHERIAEARVKTAVSAGNIVYYKVVAHYGYSRVTTTDKVKNEIMKHEVNVPTHLECEAEMITPKEVSGSNKKTTTPLVPAETTIKNEISQNPKDYDLEGIKYPPVYLDSGKVDEIADIRGFDTPLAEKIVAAVKEKKTRFASFSDLAAYTFKNGREFTDRQQTLIKERPDHVRLYEH